jgi:hypothetical protein
MRFGTRRTRHRVRRCGRLEEDSPRTPRGSGAQWSHRHGAGRRWPAGRAYRPRHLHGGHHFPALLGGEIIEPFRLWAKSQTQYAPLGLDNIVIITLPQPMIVGMRLEGGISFGNLSLAVSRASGFYPDLVMGGAAQLAKLREAFIVEAQARIFARNRGPSLLVAAGNPIGVQGVEDLARSGIRVVMASENEPGARRQYIDALSALVGEETARSILARETVAFPGRLGSSTVMCSRRSPAAMPMSGSFFTISRAILPRPTRSSVRW